MKNKVISFGDYREAIIERFLTCPECEGQYFRINHHKENICVECDIIITHTEQESNILQYLEPEDACDD